MVEIRWQLLPAAVALALVAVASFSLLHGWREGFSWLDWAVLLIAFVLLSMSITALVLFPSVALPTPSGAHAVGTAFTQWKDEKTGRSLSVQVWYPASSVSTGVGHLAEQHRQPLQFGPAVATPGAAIPFWWPVSTTGIEVLTALFQMPDFLLSHLKYSAAHARLHAPLVEAAELGAAFLSASGTVHLPVIVSSHGFYGFKADRTHFCEEMASHGYVVVGADHVGDCSMAVFPDGTRIPFSAKLKPGDHEWTVRNEGLEPRRRDVSALFDHIERLARLPMAGGGDDVVDHILGGHVDSGRIGAMGHSYGSATCVRFVQTDKRCKAVVALDPWLWPMSEDCEEGVQTPILVISSEFWDSAVNNAERRHKLVRNSHSSSHSVVVKDTKHHNFDDLPFLLGVPSVGTRLGFIGGQDPLLGFQAINELTQLFFKATLLDCEPDVRAALRQTVESSPHVHLEERSTRME